MSKRLIEFEELSKRLIEVGVKEEGFLPFSPYIYEIGGYPYGGYLPDKNLKQKIGFFDLDGSLEKVNTPSSAALIISKLAEKCKIDEAKIWNPIKQMFKDKNLNFAEEELTKILRDSSFNFDVYVEIGFEVANEFIPVRNTKELIKYMKKTGYNCVLASLSFELPVKLIAERLGFDRSYGSNLFFDESGKFQHFLFLRKEEKRNEIFKESSIPHGCYFVLDDDPNFAPVLKSGINPYFLVKELKGSFDTFITVPEAREKDDMFLIKNPLERWEGMYVELCLNSLEIELEKVKIAEEVKKSYKEFLSTKSEISAKRFSLNVLNYLFRERRPERKGKILSLLTLFEKNYDLSVAEEIDRTLSREPAYKISEKFLEILGNYK